MGAVHDIELRLNEARDAYNDGALTNAGTSERDDAIARVLASMIGQDAGRRPTVHGTEPDEKVEGQGGISNKLNQEWNDYRAHDFAGKPFEMEGPHSVTVTGESARSDTPLRYTAPDGSQKSIPSKANLVKPQDQWLIAVAHLR